MRAYSFDTSPGFGIGAAKSLGETKSMIKHEGPALSLDASPDGSTVFSASADRTVLKWSLETGDATVVAEVIRKTLVCLLMVCLSVCAARRADSQCALFGFA